MPLDHVNGERIDGMDLIYRVVPVEKYKELPGLTTLVEETSGSKFKRKVTKQYPIWAAAERFARMAYSKAGYSGPLNVDCIAQEYGRAGVVCFVFCAKIFGVEQFVVAPFELTDEQIAEMKVIGQWDEVTVN